MNKNELREEMRALRRGLTTLEVEEKSRKIRENLFALDEYKNAETVLLYLSAFKEPSTADIIADALNQKKRVAVPISDTNNFTLTLSYITGFDDLQKGAYGILEPKKIIKADLSDIDLAVIPGLAFDKNGNRMGFGKGYYDKLLKDCKAHKTALCYSFQMFDKIPSDTHDIPMNTIITEDGIYAV